MKTLSSLFLFISFSSAIWGQTAFRIEAIELLKQGDVEMKQGNWDRALQLYTLAIETDVTYAEAYFHRGRLYEGTTHETEAFADYRMARQLNPYIDYFYDYRQRVRLVELEYSGSRKIIAEDPYQFIELFINYDLYDRASMKEDLQEIADSTIILLRQQALQYLREGDFNRAQEVVDKGLKMKSEKYLFFDLQGLVFLEQYDMVAAKEYFDRAIGENPSYLPSYYNRSIVLRYNNELSEAKKDLEVVLKSTDSFMAFYMRALIFKESQDYESALGDYDQSLKLNPEFDGARLNRIYVNKKLGNYWDAFADAEVLGKKSPENDEFQNTLGIAAMLIGDYSLAISSFDRAISLNPDRPKYFYNRGLTYILNKSTLLACEDIEHSIQLGLTDEMNVMDTYCGF